MAELQKLHDGCNVVMFSHDLRTDMSLDLLHAGYDQAMIDSYLAYYGGINVWAAGFSDMVPGEVKTCAEIVSDEALLRTEFYNDWLRPQEDMRGGAGMVMPLGDGRVVAVAGSLRHKDREKREALFARDLKALTPFLRQSLQANRELCQTAELTSSAELGLESANTALLVLRDDRRLVYCNGRGQKLVEDGRLVGLDIVNRLRFTDPAANSALARALFDLRHCEPGIGLPFFLETQAKAPLMMCRPLQIRGNDTVNAPLPFLDQTRDYMALMITPVRESLAVA
ncbi:hypothetical protein [Pseudoruegeria sp. SHC-113]|uniref:hypothetical protein n=1 Tax=Pseudoruegeria sp. SHC-113 TaxID=2855439 RepID=UPI0021BB4F72|nr:hypothetical protein [Pseudoruegeria sp. SHC-113]MCT8160536.1 hypothetical protein [Pseudoruegeria sp. SHC-113]